MADERNEGIKQGGGEGGQQAPGKNPQDDRSAGGGQQGDQQKEPGQDGGGQKEGGQNEETRR